MTRNVAALQDAAEAASKAIINQRGSQTLARCVDDWDAHVGERLKAGRMLHGVTQTALAEAAGISFQQVQKYERGANRISCGRLMQFAEVLNVSPGWFFEGRDGLIGALSNDAPASMADLTSSDVALTRDIRRLPAKTRAKVVALIRALTEDLSELEG